MSMIVGPDGRVPEQDGKPSRPLSMPERIAHAQRLWDKGKTNEAFAALLSLVGFLSNGIHAVGTNFATIERNELALKKAFEEIAENQKMLSSAITTIDKRLQAVEGSQDGEGWKDGGK